jgi:conjugative transposon TraN protein
MKKYKAGKMKRVIVVLCGWWCCVASFAQANCVVSLCECKTTSLVFPDAIIHVDIGTKDVLVQKVPGAENVLMAKAGMADFRPTNITAVTKEGAVYAINVVFAECQEQTVHYLQHKTEKAGIRNYAAAILDNSRQMRGIRDEKLAVVAKVNGIYIKNSHMFFHVMLDNRSPIDYDIDYVRYFIKDRRRGKRTAVQETELIPELITGNITKARANNISAFVFAIDKFTIPYDKKLIVQIGERNGGRHLLLKVTNRKLIKARVLSDNNH